MPYWTGRPTQDQVYSIAHLSMAEWNDTRFQREDFGKLIPAAHGQLDEGGGWIDNSNGELTGPRPGSSKGKAGGPGSGSPAIISVLA